METPLIELAHKILPSHLDIYYHLEILYHFPEGQWFQVTNETSKNDGNGYDRCIVLAQHNLIAMQEKPIYASGQLSGIRRLFCYKHNLDYVTDNRF